MTILQTVLAVALMAGGLFFLVVSVVGLLRLPDYYARNHAVGKTETLGVMLVIAGLAVYEGLNLNSLKLLFIVAFVAVANPTATHAILRGALRSGLKPWTRTNRAERQTYRAGGKR